MTLTLLAHATEDQFPSPYATRRQLGFLEEVRHIEPLQVFNLPATFANEMMMAPGMKFKPARVTFEFHLVNEACLYKRVKVAVDCRPRRSGIGAIDPIVDFVGGWMAGTLSQTFKDRIPLGSTTQTLPPEGVQDFIPIETHGYITKNKSYLRRVSTETAVTQGSCRVDWEAIGDIEMLMPKYGLFLCVMGLQTDVD